MEDKVFNLDDCIAFITCQSGRVFSDALEKRLIPHNITRSQWIAMYYIYGNKNMTQRELADKMGVKQPTVVRLLQTLEAKGYLDRLGTEQDKRVKQLGLTEEGTKVYLNIIPVVEGFKTNTISGISKEDLETIIRVLDQMMNNVS